MSRSSGQALVRAWPLLALTVATAVLLLCLASAASAWPRWGRGPSLTVRSGQTYTVPQTTRLGSLTLEPGGAIVAPAGDSLTLTVDGIETGQALASTYATSTTIVPGNYRGDVVLRWRRAE